MIKIMKRLIRVKHYLFLCGVFYIVLSSMLDVQYSRDEEEEYVCIGFRDEHMGTARIGHEVSIAAGYLSNIIHCGVVASTAVRKHTALVHLAGDEVMSRPTLKADTRMRKLLSIVPRSQAALCLAMETVRDLCVGAVKMNIAQAPWRKVAEEYSITFPAWEDQWKNVVGLLRRHARHIDLPVARALLGNVPYHIVNHLCELDSRADQSALCILSYLYLASYGRLKTPESYTLTSAMGTTQMVRVWGLASQIRLRPSRKWVSTPSRERIMMGHVYQGLSLACQAFYNKQQLLQALIRSVHTTLINAYRYDSEDYPDADGRFTADSPDRNPYWARVRDNLLEHTSRVGLNREYLAKEFNQIACDIYVIGETKQLAGAEQETVLVYPIEPTLILDLPSAGAIEVGESPETPSEEAPPKDQRLMRAVHAYLEQGIHLARLVYSGDEEYDIEGLEEPSDEEVNEFVSELRELEIEEMGSQQPDERI